jgi:hypothetical protein
MKRITLLALLVAAMMVVSGVAVFAQDAAPALTWSGSLFTGFQLDGSSAPLQARLWDVDNGHPSDFWLDGALTGKNAGLKFEIYTIDTATVITDVLYGYWTPIDLLTMTGGIGMPVLYATPIEGWGLTGEGFQVKLTPVAGLTAGIAYPFPVVEGNFDTNQFQFAASYALANVATVGAGYALGTQYLWAGLSVTAVKGLTANVDLEDTLSAGGLMRIEGSFGYALGNLTPNVWVFYQANQAPGVAAWGVKPNVTYAMGNVTPYAYLEYDDGGAISVGADVAVAVEKQTIFIYADYHTAGTGTYDVGFNYRMAF